MEKDRYKAIIFDFDGVILDSVSVKTDAFAEMYRPHGSEIEAKVVSHHLEHGGISRFEKFRFYQNEFLGKEITEDQVQEMASQFSSLVFEKVVAAAALPGAFEFLEKFHKQLQFFVATGTPQNEIELIVPARNLEAYFIELHGSPTKKPEIINKIMQNHNLKASELLFIGDAMTDYDSAKSCNVDFIGVKSNTTVFPDNTIIIDNIMNISNYLYL